MQGAHLTDPRGPARRSVDSGSKSPYPETGKRRRRMDAGEEYPRQLGYSHPRKYYGTAASIIRRELLDRVPLEQIVSWGSNQPANWEKLVTNSTKNFATGPLKTPFESSLASQYFQATQASSRDEQSRQSSLLTAPTKDRVQDTNRYPAQEPLE